MSIEPDINNSIINVDETLVNTGRPFLEENKKEDKKNDIKINNLKNDYNDIKKNKTECSLDNNSIILNDEEIKKIDINIISPMKASQNLGQNESNGPATIKQKLEFLYKNETLRDQSNIIIINFMKWMIQICVICLILVAKFYVNFSELIFISILNGFILFNLILVILFGFKKKNRRKKFSEIIEHITLIILVFFFYFNEEYLKVYKSYSIIIFVVNVIFIWALLEEKDHNPYFMWDLIFRIFLSIQFFQISLKFDNLISWSLPSILWPIWALLTIILFYLLGVFLLLILSIYYKLMGLEENLHWLLWCFLLLSSYSEGLFFFSKGWIYIMQKKGNDYLLTGLYIFIGISLFLNIFTKLFYEEILRFFIAISFDSNELDELDISDPKKKINLTKAIFKIKMTKELPKDFPNLLLKYSSTYFQIANNMPTNVVNFIQTKINRKKSNNLENENSVSKSQDNSDQNNNSQIRTNSQGNNQCLICFDGIPDAVFLDCGHGGICYKCAADVWKSNGECYLCRHPIVKILKIDTNENYGKYKKVIGIAEIKKEILVKEQTK